MLMVSPLKAQPLALAVRAAVDSSVYSGQRLVEGDAALLGDGGLLRMQLYPYRSINVDASACTSLKLRQLAAFGDGVVLRVSWRSRVLCKYRASLKITSSLLSRRSRVEGEANGRRIVYRGTAGAISVGARGETLIGLSKGSADVFYGGSTQSVPSGFFVRSVDGQLLSRPMIALPPSLQSVATLPNGLHRVCTIADNQIRSAVGRVAVLVGDRTCLDTVLDDTMTVMSVTGIEQSYKFSVL
jgi:hypothetical protein